MANIMTGLLLVRSAIGYVDKEPYAIWLTVSSIVAWFSFFDIGLSNGMRNKFTAALVQKDERAAKTYVSTTYFSMFAIFFSLWIVFAFVNNSINWCSILKIKESSLSEIQTLVFIVFSYFCIQSVLRTVNTILTANQQPAKASLIDLIGAIFSLVIVLILKQTTHNSLVYLGLGLTIAPVIVLIIANLLLFNGKYKKYAPSLNYYDWNYLKDIFGLGFKFFVIQIAALIQFQTANFIIARSISMSDVTDYNIVYKYFHVLNMGFMILLTPFWSASTEAFHKNDFAWIKNMTKKYSIFLLLFIFAGALMLPVSPFAYDLLAGENVVSIPFFVSLSCLAFMITTMFGAIYVNLLNGIGAVKIQYYTSLVTPFLFILSCWLFIKYMNWGIYSIFIASIISNLNGIIIAPIQYRKIFIKGKKGIWIA
ncbi:MAG: MATE family efflux transporter [Dysgonamonadaceae bacterium]|nr:MATE family efflux transporter [Dysgonamonadaceae bacterium]